MHAVTRSPVPVALTIAGSDSGGGAGIQADLKTFQRFGVFGTSAITAITAQNTVGVNAWRAVDADLVRAQIDAVVTDLRPSAAKSGMLGTAEVASVVATALRAHALTAYVLDPVLGSTSGDSLSERETADVIRADLLPLATLVTPNLDEAERLLGVRVRDVDAMEAAAEALVRNGARAALVTGGHLDGDVVTDVLHHNGKSIVFSHPRLATTSTHGTGCTLSAAITAQLASGVALQDAVRIALDYVHEAIRTAPGLGGGHGPLNHAVPMIDER